MLVAAVDDVPDELETLEGELEEAGHEVLPRRASLPSLDSLVSWLGEQKAEAFVCDQRLSVSTYATFQGAEAISLVVCRLGLPSILVSSYFATELLAIMRWRAHIPIVIEKETLNPSIINEGFRLCESELQGDIPTQRILRRTGLSIQRVSGGNPVLVDVIIPSWDEDQVVRFPLELIEDARLKEEVVEGHSDWIIAKSNIDAERSSDLFFQDFERAPSLEGIWERVWHPSY